MDFFGLFLPATAATGVVIQLPPRLHVTTSFLIGYYVVSILGYLCLIKSTFPTFHLRDKQQLVKTKAKHSHLVSPSGGEASSRVFLPVSGKRKKSWDGWVRGWLWCKHQAGEQWMTSQSTYYFIALPALALATIPGRCFYSFICRESLARTDSYFNFCSNP